MQPGRALKARYVLQARLGAGGQGEVWRARDYERGVDIALKILQPAPGRSAVAWDALVHEHDSASRLDHPHILKVYPPEREDGTFLLPMELASGGDLRQLRGSDYLAVVPVLIEIAEALEHAHDCGVIHRDLKPGNALFDAGGSVKVADFGVAGRAPDTGGDIRGLSPFAASPEQLRGEPPAPADDIYGLGALAYELLSRHPPHSPHFDARRVQQQPVPPLVPTEQVPPRLERLITRMLAKEARDRPASMREVIDELKAALNDTLTIDFDTEPAQEEPAPVAPPKAARTPAMRALDDEMLDDDVLDDQALREELRHTPVPGPRLEPVRSALPRVLAALGGAAAAAVLAGTLLWRYFATALPVRLPGEPPIAAAGQPAPDSTTPGATARTAAAGRLGADERPAGDQAAKASTASPDDAYAAAAGEGFAALGAGRLDEARAAFERAHALRPNGAEAAEGLRRVEAAAQGRQAGAPRTGQDAH